MREKIRQVLSSLHMPLDGEPLEQLCEYQALLCEWNERMDLTNVPLDEMPLRHFADSLKPLFDVPELFGSGIRIIDVGTGAGFPGLPLAIVRKDIEVTLLDAQRKRCDFLAEVAGRLSLSNVRVLHLRAEDAGRAEELRERFDLAVARAVAPMNILLEYLLPFIKVNGHALAWKGPAVPEELESAERASELLGGGSIETRECMLLDRTQILAFVQKKQMTPKQYPRKSGIPSKKPLGTTVEKTKHS